MDRLMKPLVGALLIGVVILWQGCQVTPIKEVVEQTEIKNKTMTEEMKKIVYVMDPQCGWCYGNSQNMVDLYEEFGNRMEFEVVVGGMWLGDDAPKGGQGFGNFIAQHAPPMAQTTGAVLSEAFYALTQDESYTFSSMEPSAAIVLVKEIAPQQAFLFAKAVQNAMFIEGKRLDKLATYLPIVEAMGIDNKVFEAQWLSEANKLATQKEFARVGGMVSGFPTTLLEENGEMKMLASGYFEKSNMVKKIKTIIE